MHAHPLPDARHAPSIAQPETSYASCTITSSPTLASQQQKDGLSQQTRRLQLRNTGFRGPVLSFRRISPLLGASTNGIEPFTRPVNSENSPASVEKRMLYGEDLPQSPVNILQEIHKISTRKKRNSPSPAPGAIFEDNTITGKDDASETSWYNEGSNNCSPATSAMTPARMNQLREVSLNQKTPPPPSTPLLKHVKGRNSTRAKNRSLSSEAATYIEHLESELASAHAKLEWQPSPRTSKLRSAKLRTLTTENRSLKHDNAEWEKRFEARVQEERNKRLEADLEMRGRMRILEDELEMKDARTAELEWEVESMRVRVRDLEGLEAINVSLERRIEALTNLLVQSPAKFDVSSASTSPVRRDPSKRTPRPRSMLPRIPPSPGGLRLSLATVSESAIGRSQSLGSPLNIVESPEDEPETEIGEENPQSPVCNQDTMSPRYTRQSGSFDGRSRASASFRSATSSTSRSMSMRSSGSFRPISWDSAEQEPGSTTRQRKMRRFPSGSSSLKPLILPSAAVVPSIPASAPIYPSIEATARRDCSAVSLDPTSAFLSTFGDDSTHSTPDPPRSERSASWAQEQTLKALEGKFRDTDYHVNNERQGTLSLSPDDGEQSMGFREIPTDKSKRRSRPRSLQKELEEAEIKQAAGAQAKADTDYLEIYEDDLIPVEDDEQPGQTMNGMDYTPSRLPPIAFHSRQRRLVADSENTPSPIQQKITCACATPSSLKAPSSTALTSEHAHGLFTRLTNVITQTKQDPYILARRLLANAWSQGSKRLGGMAWWLLGLVYGTRWRKRKRWADIGIVEADSSRDFDWQHFSAQASRSTTNEHYFRDYGGTHNNRESWLSPPHISSRVVPSISPSSGSRIQPHRFPCKDCEEPSSRRTFRLWFQFSIAIILAVGMAVKHGPGTLLAANPPRLTVLEHTRPRENEPLLKEQRRRQQKHDHPDCTEEASQRSGTSYDTTGMDSGYGSITFAEILGPADFENP